MTRKTEVGFKVVSDRQDLIKLMETRKQGLEPYMCDRDDMYWADVTITDYGLRANLTYCINAVVGTPVLGSGMHEWSASYQYGPKEFDTPTLRVTVIDKWLISEEFKEAEGWLQNLISAGYYDHGRALAPNVNAGKCKHCNSYFEKGTTHPHTYLTDWNFKGEKRIIHHHKLMEKIIKERGLYKRSVSGLPDIPSLEELGELEPYIII